MSAQCPKCHDSILTDANGKPPPWCPRCGTDLKAFAASKPQLAGVGASSSNSALPNAGLFRDENAGSVPRDQFADQEGVPSYAAEEPPVAESRSAESDSLDNPEQVFKAKILWQGVAWLCALACFVIVAAAGSQLVNPPKIKKSQTGSIIGVMVLFGAGGLGSAFVGVRLGGTKYLVFADRLVAIEGGRSTFMPWQQIREVYHSVHPGWRKYRIVARGAQAVTLRSDIKGHTRLGELVAEHVAERLFPDACRQFEAGRAVSFGPLSISQAGVICNGVHLPWHQIVLITFGLNPKEYPGNVVSNMIHLRFTPSCMVEMGDIPNYRLLEMMLRRVHPSCLPCEGA